MAKVPRNAATPRRVPADPPLGLVVILLKALYHTEHSSRTQLSEIKTSVTKAVAP
jgi:hypothetical protein